MRIREHLTVVRDGKTLSISYGVDPEQGFVASVFNDGRLVVAYYSIDTDHTGLSGLLNVLVDAGVFGREHVQDALCQMLLKGSADGINEKDAEKAALVINNLKYAYSTSLFRHTKSCKFSAGDAHQ